MTMTSDTWETLAASIPSGTPLISLNLLRFHDRTRYHEGSGHAPCSGREAYYERYASVTVPLALAGGAKVLLSGTAAGHPICPSDEQWHDFLMLEYPDIAVLMAMGAEPAYRDCIVHRDASLADWRFFITVRNEHFR